MVPLLSRGATITAHPRKVHVRGEKCLVSGSGQCLPECFFKASLMVMKFLRDFDILQPAIVRWPVCRK